MRPAYRNRVDWSLDVTLKPESYVSHTRYDALGRPTQVVAPHRDAPEANVNVLQPTYNEAGLLERLERASARRSSTATASRLDTTMTPQTFRLVHMRTEGGHSGRVLQDLHYTFDPAGNITHIRDDAHQEVFFANARVEARTRYRYDALFRLTEATGREHLGQAGAHPHSHNDAPRVGRVGIPHASDGEALGRYLERYLYDAVGNIASVQHIGTNPHNPGWTRNYAYAEPSQLEPDKVSNRLTSTTVGRISAPAVHKYDEHGNMLDMPHLAGMRWNELDQLQMTQRQVVNDTDGTGRHGERTWYVYDGGGQRIRKVTERPDGRIKDERLYLGAFEIYREHRSQREDLVRETLHVTDDAQRIALVETRISGDEKEIPRRQVRYQLANHLGSASLEVDDQARILSYEEYSPYGSTTYQAVRSQLQTPKRYRYTAMERDDESGLSYHSARYYAPWLGRWTSTDPLGTSDSVNLYQYVSDNPIRLIDPSGLSGWDRLWGAVTAVGGALETAVGGALVATGVATSEIGIGIPIAAAGAVVTAHGVDTTVSGIRTLVDGAPVDTVTSQGLQAAGMSRSAANLTDAGIGFVGTLGAGALVKGAAATGRTVTAARTAASASKVDDVATVTKIDDVARAAGGGGPKALPPGKPGPKALPPGKPGPKALPPGSAPGNVAIDANAAIRAIEAGEAAALDAALAGRSPIIPIQAVKEFLVKGDVNALRGFLTSRGGRVAAGASDEAAAALQAEAKALGRSLKPKDAKVAASAQKEGVPLITRDQKLRKFLNAIGIGGESF